MEKGNEIKTVVPTLRFPEFREMNGWEILPMEYLCQILNNQRKPIPEILRVKGPYPYYGASGIVDYINNYIFDEELLLIGEDGAKWGAYENSAYIANGKYWVNNHAHVLRPIRVNIVVLKNYLIQLDLTQYITGAAPPKLTLGKLKEIRIPISKKTQEQQKIADCLSSLDELIEATTQKVEALKEHKKGLMQRLFPAEGKNVPDLRFPEFQASEKWKRKIIQDICNITTGNKNTQDKKENGIYPFFVRSPKVERIDSWSFDGEAILTAGDGVGVGKIFHYYVGKMGVHQRVYLLYDIQCNSKYLYYFFSEFFYERVKKMSAKNSVDSVRKDMISDMPLLLPSSQEQQKIADCHSSLDELIEATSRKVEILKEHKKGLMQQLFPKI